MNDALRRTFQILLVCAAATTSILAQPARPAKNRTGAAAFASPPRLQVAVESVLDRRTTGDFPPPALTVTLALSGEDASGVRSARARVTRAVDQTGRNLAETGSKTGEPSWQEAREAGPPAPRLELASPSRKAKTVTSLEGVVETFLPGRDPAASVKIDRVMAKKDRPLAVPALAKQRIQLRVLSKAGLEREKKQAEARKKAQAAKKAKSGKADGFEAMGEALGGALASMLEMLFTTVGENDLILRVDDPGKKVFSFDLVAPDGSPIRSYGTTDYEPYRIVRMLEPVPANASLQVRLKTPKSFAEVPFTLADVKLP